MAAATFFLLLRPLLSRQIFTTDVRSTHIFFSSKALKVYSKSILLCPTANGGVQNGSSVGGYMQIAHTVFFGTFRADLYAPVGDYIDKISALGSVGSVFF